MMHDYQQRRVMTLLDPTQDALGAGYHTIQSTIAVGSGGIIGKGWQNGTQTHLDFLPEKSTDFIFAVFSEEFGLVGNSLLLLLYLDGNRSRHGHYSQCIDSIHPSHRGLNHADFLHIYICQHGYGCWHATGGRCAATAYQLRRHFDGDNASRFWYFDEHTDAS